MRMALRRGHAGLVGAGLMLVAFACGSDPPSPPPPPPSPGPDAPDPAGPPGPAGSSTPPSAPGDPDAADDPPSEDPTVPAVRYWGRFDATAEDGPTCGWPGCQIAANFRGTEVSVTFDEKLDDWMIGGPSEWDVTIDGVSMDKLVLWGGKQTRRLATGLAPGPHSVLLFKRSEAQNGITQFLGFDFGEDGALLPPPPRKKRRIEVIGDSGSTGFGIEGRGPVCPGVQQAATFENFHKSFGARLGELFDAEVHGTAYSGKGIVRNIWRPDPETMPVLYGRANPIDPRSSYDLRAYVPKVIVVMIGGLDFAVGQPYDDGPESVADFTRGYEEFVAGLRTHYPRAEIFCVVSPSAEDIDGHAIRTELLAGVTTAVTDLRGAGDAHVTLVEPAVAKPEELTGCEGHGNAAFHDRLAGEIATAIRQATGW